MSTAAQKQSVGRYGEDVAARWLVGAGMEILDRNWRCAAGELDLVMRDGPTLVFCEVKTRSSAIGGHPLEAVDEVKLGRLRRLAAQWLEAHEVRPEGVRIDLVGVIRPGRGAAEVIHVPGVG